MWVYLWVHSIRCHDSLLSNVDGIGSNAVAESVDAVMDIEGSPLSAFVAAREVD